MTIKFGLLTTQAPRTQISQRFVQEQRVPSCTSLFMQTISRVSFDSQVRQHLWVAVGKHIYHFISSLALDVILKISFVTVSTSQLDWRSIPIWTVFHKNPNISARIFDLELKWYIWKFKKDLRIEDKKFKSINPILLILWGPILAQKWLQHAPSFVACDCDINMCAMLV